MSPQQSTHNTASFPLRDTRPVCTRMEIAWLSALPYHPAVVVQMVKNLPAIWETWVWSLGWEDSPGGRHGNLLQYSCLENPHAQRSLVGYNPWGQKESDMTERLSTAQMNEQRNEWLDVKGEETGLTHWRVSQVINDRFKQAKEFRLYLNIMSNHQSWRTLVW